MATQFISRNEFQEGLNDLYGRLTRYIDIRLDAFGTRIDSTNSRIDKIETIQLQIQRDIASIATFQKAMPSPKLPTSNYWSGCRDLNPGPLVPQTSALTKLRHSPQSVRV